MPCGKEFLTLLLFTKGSDFMAFDRIDRVSEEVKRELASIIRDLKDPRLPQMISVVNVNVTKDFKFAKAYISIMGTDEEKAAGIEALKSAAGFIRREIGHRIKLRFTPQFSFVLDTTIEYGAHISKVLADIERKDSNADKNSDNA